MIYYISILLIGVGIYGLLTQKDLFKHLISLTIIDTAVNIFIIALGFVNKPDVQPPIYTQFIKIPNFVDPLPQALVLTAIVIGVGVLALGASLLIKVKEMYGTTNVEELRSVKE